MMFYNLNQVCVFLHLADSAGVCTGVRGQCWCHVIWCGASSISIRKVSMGVSPMSLKKNRCSRHLRPMERRAGRRSSNLANLPKRREKKKIIHHFDWNFIIFIISSIFFHSLSYLPGWSGYFCFVYDSSDAYTFSLSPSTSCGFERPLASNNTIRTNVAPVHHHHTHRWWVSLTVTHLGWRGRWHADSRALSCPSACLSFWTPAPSGLCRHEGSFRSQYEN